jgi:hypothetical protein
MSMLIALLLATAADFDPLRFFAGRTQGQGELKVVLRSRVPIAVRGTGRVDADGALVLDQVVTEGDKPPRNRRWHLRRIAPGRYQGTLTDAQGLVTGEVDGARLHLAFTSDKGFKVQQWLVLADDGRSATNRLEARRFGVTVATLDERIVKID